MTLFIHHRNLYAPRGRRARGTADRRGPDGDWAAPQTFSECAAGRNGALSPSVLSFSLCAPAGEWRLFSFGSSAAGLWARVIRPGTLRVSRAPASYRGSVAGRVHRASPRVASCAWDKGCRAFSWWEGEGRWPGPGLAASDALVPAWV